MQRNKTKAASKERGGTAANRKRREATATIIRRTPAVTPSANKSMLVGSFLFLPFNYDGKKQKVDAVLDPLCPDVFACVCVNLSCHAARTTKKKDGRDSK
jgi:hypothetical protein